MCCVYSNVSAEASQIHKLFFCFFEVTMEVMALETENRLADTLAYCDEKAKAIQAKDVKPLAKTTRRSGLVKLARMLERGELKEALRFAGENEDRRDMLRIYEALSELRLPPVYERLHKAAMTGNLKAIEIFIKRFDPRLHEMAVLRGGHEDINPKHTPETVKLGEILSKLSFGEGGKIVMKETSRTVEVSTKEDTIAQVIDHS